MAHSSQARELCWFALISKGRHQWRGSPCWVMTTRMPPFSTWTSQATIGTA
jgi:hypothetical protein